MYKAKKFFFSFKKKTRCPKAGYLFPYSSTHLTEKYRLTLFSADPQILRD